MLWWTADISSSQVSQSLSWESASSLLWPIIAHCSHMLFLFTVTEWGHIIYSAETTSNAAPPREETLTGGGQKNRGFTSSRTAQKLKLFKFNDTPPPANKNLDNLHGCARCKINHTMENWDAIISKMFDFYHACGKTYLAWRETGGVSVWQVYLCYLDMI